MPQWKLPNPWNPNYEYAIPKYVRDEPSWRPEVTKYTPRGTYGAPGKIVPPWQSGYVVPDYIKKEPLNQSGAFRTKYLPRRTISASIPNYLSGDEQTEEERRKQLYRTLGIAAALGAVVVLLAPKVKLM
jgi:hypothetical protein